MRRLAAGLGWTTAALAVVTAAGGVAARPGGWALGAPTLGAALGGLVALALLARAAGPGAGRLLLAAAPPVVAVVAGLTLPGVGGLSGPPILAVVLAAAAAALAAAAPRWSGWAFLPVVAALYLGVAARVQHEVGPQGDEPHYLMVADSLWRDHDLDLSRDYEEGRYRAFHPGPLAPHYRVRGRHGEIYSLHAVGLSLLVLPAYVAGGYRGASFFMAALAVWLAWEIRRLVRSWLARSDLADGVGWAVALAPPLVHYSGLVFTEVPAALGVALVLRWAREGVSPRKALACGLVLAGLPWLNVRYAILSLLLLGVVLVHRPPLRTALGWVAAPVGSAMAIVVYHSVLYGFFDPRRVYGRRPELSLGTVPLGLPGLLLDQEFGLLVYAPLFALAVPGLWRLCLRSRGAGALLIAMVAAVLVTAAAWPMWRGGFNPPARFLVPIVPVLALAVAARLASGLTAPAALLVGWSVFTGIGGGLAPHLVHRDRDGTAPFFRAYSGGEEWTRLLPGFVLDEKAADRGRLALVWGVTLALAVAVGRRPGSRVGPGGLLAATVGLLVAAGVASRVSTARTEGRDAVRVVGRPALIVPGWTFARQSSAVWPAAVLGWGPLYEPHRSPLAVGARLPLPPGDYQLSLDIEAVPSDASPPVLEAIPDGAPGGPRVGFTAEGPGAFRAAFSVPPDSHATTLVVQGGPPFVLKELRLSTFHR